MNKIAIGAKDGWGYSAALHVIRKLYPGAVEIRGHAKSGHYPEAYESYFETGATENHSQVIKDLGLN